MDKRKHAAVEAKDIRPGPITHASLPEWFLIRAQLVYHIIGAGGLGSFHEFIVNFQRDADPVAELAIWERIAAALIALSGGAEKTDSEASEIVSGLLVVSMMPSVDPSSLDGSLRPLAEAYVNAARQAQAELEAA